MRRVNLNLVSHKKGDYNEPYGVFKGESYDCVKFISGYQKVLVELCKMYYGMFRGRASGHEREYAGWTGEEQA